MSPQDEFDQYLSEPAVYNIAYKADLVGWWRGVGVVRFPRLSYMAVDFLIISSSPTETERLLQHTIVFQPWRGHLY
jgi:hypothetical protein